MASLTSSTNPATLGQNVTLTASVSPADATGVVTFYDGTMVLGSKVLSAGRASLTTNLLASGMRSLRVYYGGDANYSPGTSSVLAQVVSSVPANGFQPPMNPTTFPYGPYSFVVGDFNGDGKPDLVLCDYSVSIMLGNGDGTFQSPVAINVGSGTINAQSVAVADVNGDGKSDLIIGYLYNATASVGVLLGNGDGTFQPPVFYGAFNRPEWVAVGDFNGDGRVDIAVGDSGNSTISVLLGNGDGTFLPPITVDQGSPTFVVGDFNGDGIADLGVSYGTSFSILLGNGDGTFRKVLNNAAVHGSMALGDFNGDGKMDLAVANNDGSMSVLLGNGDGTFQGAVNYGAGLANSTYYAVGIAAGDFNGDGHADLALTNALGVSVLLGNGDGTFQQPTYYASGNSSLAVGDFNGDGRSDLVSGNGSVLLGAVTSVPSVSSVGVTNAAALSYYAGELPVTPGGLASIYGNFLLSAAAGASGSPLPTQLSGLSVNFTGGLAAPLISASAGQVTFQIPWELAGQSQTSLTVTSNGQSSAPQIVNVKPIAPGIFGIYDLSNRPVNASNPAIGGSTILQIYCTGLGTVSNQPATGLPGLSSPLSLTTTIPEVEIGESYAAVLFSGLVPGLVGVYQVNAQVPVGSFSSESIGSSVGVEVISGGVTSNSLMIAVQ